MNSPALGTRRYDETIKIQNTYNLAKNKIN